MRLEESHPILFLLLLSMSHLDLHLMQPQWATAVLVQVTQLQVDTLNPVVTMQAMPVQVIQPQHMDSQATVTEDTDRPCSSSNFQSNLNSQINH